MEMLAMSGQPLPSDVEEALDLLRGALARRWSVNDLARLCRIPGRTLEKHFRRFVGRAPMEFLRTMRLDPWRFVRLSGLVFGHHIGRASIGLVRIVPILPRLAR